MLAFFHVQLPRNSNFEFYKKKTVGQCFQKRLYAILLERSGTTRSKTNLRTTIAATAILFGRSSFLWPSILISRSFAPTVGPGSRSSVALPEVRMVDHVGGDDSRQARRGAFILFEGVDRCGKTTQANLLVKNLNQAGRDACLMRFPVPSRVSLLILSAQAESGAYSWDPLDPPVFRDGVHLYRQPPSDRTTPIGQLINAFLQKTADIDDRCVHLLFSANRWEAESKIRERLKAGTTVVCDRYAYSGVAFSASKPGLELGWCKDPDRGLPAPDTVLFLDICVEDAMKRGQFGKERYEKEEFQRTVRATFLSLMEEDKVNGVHWKMLDATRSIKSIQDEIIEVATSAIECVKGKEISPLWPALPEKGLVESD